MSSFLSPSFDFIDAVLTLGVAIVVLLVVVAVLLSSLLARRRQPDNSEPAYVVPRRDRA